MSKSTVEDKRVFVCGTRAVKEQSDATYRVVCATCGAGGTVRHDTKDSATKAAVRDSNRACPVCGAD